MNASLFGIYQRFSNGRGGKAVGLDQDGVVCLAQRLDDGLGTAAMRREVDLPMIGVVGGFNVCNDEDGR